MAYHVDVLPPALRALKRVPKTMQVRLLEAMRELGENPRPHGCCKLAGEENTWRIRVGDYRIVYEIYDDRLLILVVRVGHRKDIYRG